MPQVRHEPLIDAGVRVSCSFNLCMSQVSVAPHRVDAQPLLSTCSIPEDV